MGIPYQFKSTNIIAIVFWGPTVKFNYYQYFQLYGMSIKYLQMASNELSSWQAVDLPLAVKA